MLAAFQSVNLALRFLLELCVLAALCFWGFQQHTGHFWLKIALGLGVPMVAAVVWATFGAPKAALALHGPLLLLLELLLFGGAAVALWFAHRQTMAVIFAVVVVVNRILMFVWHQ